MLGTVYDGVKKAILTASRVKTMTTQKKPEGVASRASRVKCVTAYKSGQHDGVKCRSRQSEDYFGGEMMASHLCSCRRQPQLSIYSFLIFIHKKKRKFGETLSPNLVLILELFKGFQPLNPYMCY